MRTQLCSPTRPRPRLSAQKPPHGPGGARRILGIERAGQRLLPGGVLPLRLGSGVHDATAYWDQLYAQPRRRVDPLEQHVHTCSR
jgi:hypothetical protein